MISDNIARNMSSSQETME